MLSNTDKARLYGIARETLARGGNIVERLTRGHGADRRVAIEIAYALQSGSYTAYAETDTAVATRREGHAILEPVVAGHGIATMLDCGAGEGTRWFDFAAPLDHLVLLDASWHRLRYARANLAKVRAVAQASCVKADMLNLPFAPLSFDGVFTSHAVEPNTDEDSERIIESLFATARRAVVMFEPNYRDAHPEMRARMDTHGYARNIWDVAHAQRGFDCIAEGTFEVSPNPDNRTSYMVFVRKEPPTAVPIRHVAPVSGAPLAEFEGHLVDADGCFGYPVIGGIACLAEEDGVFLGYSPGD